MKAYTEYRTILVEDLINTYDTFLEYPEHLSSTYALDRFLGDHKIFFEESVTWEELQAVRELREVLRPIWNGETIEAISEPLNELLSETSITPQVHPISNGTWYVGYIVPQDKPLIERLKIEAALGIMIALEQHGIERLRSCAAAPCRDVYIDTTRNRSRRFCSDRCANRYNIAAFRERQSTDPNES